MADADLYNLEILSLVAKITQEIDNYTGLNDKTLAEFIINVHEKSKTLDKFKAKLKKVGTSFPDSFVENVDRLILGMHPKYKKRQTLSAKAQGKAKATDDELTELDRKKRMFPGLAVKDKEIPAAVPDDIFLEELGDLVAGKKTHPRPSDDEPSPKRQRRDRSISPRRRSPSPPRGRGGYGNRNGGARQQVDERPILFKIYDGKVSGIKEFGAFVTLDGVVGRVEGMHTFTSAGHILKLFTDRYGSCIQHPDRSTGKFRCRPSQSGEACKGEGYERRKWSSWAFHEGCGSSNGSRSNTAPTHQV